METRELEFKNRHGKRMPATLRLPEGKAKGTFLMLHGLGGHKEQGIILSIASAIASAGYATLTFNNADNPESPDGDFFHSTNTGYFQDVEDIVSFVKSEPWFSPPLALGGHSQGGSVAIHFVARSNEPIERLLLVASAVSWRMGALFWIPWVIPWIVSGRRFWRGPYDKKFALSSRWIFDFLKFDGYRDVRNITCPVLIISAAKDRTVAKPFEHRHFASLLKRAQHQVVPGASHAFVGKEKEVADIVKQWLTSS